MQWLTLEPGIIRNRVPLEVMFRNVGALQQTVRLGARGFRSRSLLTALKFLANLCLTML
jgi:hypothetical protein